MIRNLESTTTQCYSKYLSSPVVIPIYPSFRRVRVHFEVKHPLVFARKNFFTSPSHVKGLPECPGLGDCAYMQVREDG